MDADGQPIAGRTRTPPGEVVRLTPSEWHAMLESRSFLDHADNQLHPRRLCGAPVQIIPDDSYR
jgi:hypothetical protein